MIRWIVKIILFPISLLLSILTAFLTFILGIGTTILYFLMLVKFRFQTAFGQSIRFGYKVHGYHNVRCNTTMNVHRYQAARNCRQ